MSRAMFRAAAFIVVVAAPIGVFASLPPDVGDATRAGGSVERARALCAASEAPFGHMFPPVDRATRGRAERACATLAAVVRAQPAIAIAPAGPAAIEDVAPTLRAPAEAAVHSARTLVDAETDLSRHMIAVLVVCFLAAFLAVCGMGVLGALYAGAAALVACWGGVHVWPCLVAGATVLVALPCAQSPGTPREERLPASGPAALLASAVGALWALPVLAYVAGQLRLASGARAHVLVLVAELAAAASFALVVVPVFVHFFRSGSDEGRGPAAKLGMTLASVVLIVAGSLLAYALTRP